MREGLAPSKPSTALAITAFSFSFLPSCDPRRLCGHRRQTQGVGSHGEGKEQGLGVPAPESG